MFLSCSFYLYRLRKYVSYGFPIINFCNPGVLYETPCICPDEPALMHFQTRLSLILKSYSVLQILLGRSKEYSKAIIRPRLRQTALLRIRSNTHHSEVKVNQSHYRPEVPRGFQEIKVPRLSDNGPEWWSGCQPYGPAAFTPRKYSWYSFLLETESNSGPQRDRKDYVNEKFQ